MISAGVIRFCHFFFFFVRSETPEIPVFPRSCFSFSPVWISQTSCRFLWYHFQLRNVLDNGPGFDGNARKKSAACCRLLLEFGARLCCKLLQVCNSGGDSRSVYAIVCREGAGLFLQDLMQGEVHSSLLMLFSEGSVASRGGASDPRHGEGWLMH